MIAGKSVREARKILIERVLNSTLSKEDKIEISKAIIFLFSEENYKDNVKTLRKVYERKNK